MRTKIYLATSRLKPTGKGKGVAVKGLAKSLIYGDHNGGKRDKGLRDYKNAHVKVGWGALSRSGSAGIMHAKLMAFSETGGRKNVVLSASGNLSYSNDVAYNDQLTWSDKTSYDGLVAYIKVLMKDKKMSSKNKGTVKSGDGKHQLFFMPTYKRDPIMEGVRKVTCVKGRTRIDDAHFYVGGGTEDSWIDLLVAKQKQGCRVRVATNSLTEHWSESGKKKLVKAGVLVVDASRWADKAHHDLVYLHLKGAIVTGAKGLSDTLWQGSTTMNKTAYKYNDNQIVQSTLAADISAAERTYGAMFTRERRLS